MFWEIQGGEFFKGSRPHRDEMYSQTEGETAVRLARWSIEVHLQEEETPKPPVPTIFSRKGGAFVTIQRHPVMELRGCIGYPDASSPLEDAVVRAAIMSCHDPRFPPLSVEDLGHIVVEVSLLEPAELVEVSEPLGYVRAIVVGRDGLIVRSGAQSGLLLPQVPVDGGWDVEEFLSQSCMKAGLLPDAWFEPTVMIYRFQAEVFTEVEPKGRVIRRELSAVHDGHRG